MPEEATTSVEFPRRPHGPSRGQEHGAYGPAAARIDSISPAEGAAPAAAVREKFHLRVRHGIRRPHNWFQLIRFGAVGTSGYVVNLAVFALCVHAAGIDYRLAAVIAWIVSVLNNFWLNRHW